MGGRIWTPKCMPGCKVNWIKAVRYLYTAKRNAEGTPVYLVAGLDLDAEDFAYPGTPIEEEIVPCLEDALSGKTSFSQDIVDTTWGHIFAAFYPVYSKENPEEIRHGVHL